jgi:hypothetical protein
VPVRWSIVARRVTTVRGSALRSAARLNLAVADRTENHQFDYSAIWLLLIATLLIDLPFGIYSAYSQTLDSGGTLSAGTTDASNSSCTFSLNGTLDLRSLNQTIGSLSDSATAGNYSDPTNITFLPAWCRQSTTAVNQTRETTVATRFIQTDEKQMQS